VNESLDNVKASGVNDQRFPSPCCPHSCCNDGRKQQHRR
jgi:hypothetical protein